VYSRILAVSNTVLFRNILPDWLDGFAVLQNAEHELEVGVAILSFRNLGRHDESKDRGCLRIGHKSKTCTSRSLG
jgi:hypothetical protein